VAVGLSFAVADAHVQVRRAARFLTTLPGGQEAVREVCDALLGARARPARAPTARSGHDDLSPAADIRNVGLIIGVVVLSSPPNASRPATTSVGGPMPDPVRGAQWRGSSRPERTASLSTHWTPPRSSSKPDEGTVEMQQVQLGFRDSDARRGRRAAPTANWTGHGIIELEGAVHVSGIVPGTQGDSRYHQRASFLRYPAQLVTTHDR